MDANAADRDDEPEGEPDEGDAGRVPRADLSKTKERLEGGADRAVEEFDEGIVDLLAWLLETETKARIYVYLRRHHGRTSDEIAEGTGLYPSTVREALAELHEDEVVQREKRKSEGAGNNPYEYHAIPPSTLVRGVVSDVQDELNTVFTLDRRLGRDPGSDDRDEDDGDGPVTITVEGGQERSRDDTEQSDRDADETDDTTETSDEDDDS